MRKHGYSGPGRQGLNPTGSRKRLQEERRPSWIFKEEVLTPQSSMRMGAVGRTFDRVSECERAHSASGERRAVQPDWRTGWFQQMGKLPRWPRRPPQARLKDGAHGVTEESEEVWLRPGRQGADLLAEGGSGQNPPAGSLVQQSKPRRPSWNSRSGHMTGELLQRKALGLGACIANPILFPNSHSWDWNKELTLSLGPCLLPSCHKIWPCCHHAVLLNSQARSPSLLSLTSD